jgi:hypothetical protein
VKGKKLCLGGNFQEQFNHCDLSQGAQGFEFSPKFFWFQKMF